MIINHVFTGIAVADYEKALAWYTRFFGRPPDVIVTENEAMWHVAEARQRPLLFELGAALRV